MTKEDYVFTKRMQPFIDNRFLDLIIEDHERNLSMLNRKKIQDYINSKGKPKNPKGLMFMYILFNRSRPHGYLDELGKYLINKINVESSKDLDELYNEYKKELEYLKLKPPVVNKQVIKNIKYYLSKLDIAVSD